MDRKIRKYMAFRENVEVGEINDGDVLVAAFCMVNSYTLVTDNTRRFETIHGLDIINWKE